MNSRIIYISLLLSSTALASDPEQCNKSYLQIESKINDSAWMSHFLSNYSDLLSEMPDVHQIASSEVKEGIKEKKNFSLDPDNTFYNLFKGASTSPYSFTGWEHREDQIDKSMTLTQAALLNFAYKWDSDPSMMNLDSGLYKVGYGAKQFTDRPWPNNAAYSHRNEIKMLPKVFWQVVRKADIQTKYTKRTTDYWSKNYHNFVEVTRDAFKIAAFASLVNEALSTSDFCAAMNIIDDPKNSDVHWFDIYGYHSTDIIVIKNPATNALLLYIPGSETPFTRYDNQEKLRINIKQKLVNKANQTALKKHFSLYDRQDGVSYTGVDKAIEQIASGGWANSYIQYNNGKSKIYGDIFENIANATKKRAFSDGDVQIKSNSEALGELVLRDANTLFNVLPILDIVAPEIGLPASIALSATQLGLSIDMVINSDTQDERLKHIPDAIVNGVNLAAVALIPAGIKFGQEIAKHSRILGESIPELALPERVTHLRTGEHLSITHPVNNEQYTAVRLNDTQEVVILKQDAFGTYQEVDWSTGQVVPGKKVYKTVNPENNRTQWLSRGGLLGGVKNRPKLAPLSIALPDKIVTSSGLHIDLEKLKIAANGANFFHGSRSSSLISFSPSMGEHVGQILPMGDLIDAHLYPLSGEAGNSLLEASASHRSVSATDLINMGNAYDYATNIGRAGRFNLDEELRKIEQVKQQMKTMGIGEQKIAQLENGVSYKELDFHSKEELLLAGKLTLSQGRITRFESLSPREQKLAQESFPILYGFKLNSNSERIIPIHSDIKGEFGIRDGVSSEQIAVILTDKNHLDEVQEYLSENGFSHIPVRSFKDIYAN